MSYGKIYQFIDFTKGFGGDTGDSQEYQAILPLANGQPLDADNINRGPENLRQRTEALRDAFTDALYRQGADLGGLCLAGPGTVSWAGVGNAVVLSDVLYLIPFLTPGFAQTPPIPPVASKLGTLTLKKSGGAAGIVVTSALRSYYGGDTISVEIVAGTVYSPSASQDGRTIQIVVTGSTTLSTVMATLSGLVTLLPTGLTSSIVTCALAGGASGTDLIQTTQAKQFVAGNFDGECHTLTPANFATFFAIGGNPLQEGDSLCISYAAITALPTDIVPLGGRRQSIPENSNTTVPAGSLFNSRVSPASLVNALPICKVVNGVLVFINGQVVSAGATGFDFGAAYVNRNTNNQFKGKLTLFPPDQTDANVPLYDNYGTGGATTGWRPLYKGTSGSNAARLYTSGTGADGFAVVSNATWIPGTAKWHQDDNSLPSTMLLSSSAGFAYWTKQASHVLDWTTWDFSPLVVDSTANNVTARLLVAQGLVSGNGFSPMDATIAGRIAMYTTDDNAITIEPFGLILNSGLYATPTAGFSLTSAITGLTHSSIQYIYAYLNAGLVDVEVSSTQPSAASGYRTKTGDVTRVYLGSIYVQSTGKIKAFRRVNRRTTWVNSHLVGTGTASVNALDGSVGTVSSTTPVTVALSPKIPNWVTRVWVDASLGGTTSSGGQLEITGNGVQQTDAIVSTYSVSPGYGYYIYTSLDLSLQFTILLASTPGTGLVFLAGYED